MTAAELAQALHAKRIGKGKWVAKCPAHSDRNPSLSIAVGRKVPVVLKCMSAGCDTKAILEAAGLSWSSLFDGKATPEIRQRMSDEENLEKLNRQLGLIFWLQAIDIGKRNYWVAAERRVREEIEQLYWKLMPDLERHEKIRKFWEQEYRNKRLDWLQERGQYGLDGSV